MRYFFASYTCGHDNSGRGTVALECNVFPPIKILIDQAVESSSALASTIIITSLFEFQCSEDFNSFNGVNYKQVKQ